MSTSTKTTMPKPKRPLSGYNLYYRYKRNKVLEATAHLNGRDRDNEAVIRAVLSALPGLEGVSPTSPLFRLCAVPVDEFRAAAIRKAMEGKLFPNENPRKRVHCKVHGMGFVEMGRMMRQTWGRADKLTKDVFCELAEVGRARYRRRVAEYKLSIECAENAKTANETMKRWREAQAASFTARQAPLSSDPMPEAPSVWATTNPRPSAASASLESRNGVQASADLRFRAPATSDGPSQGRPTSMVAELGHRDASFFEPLPDWQAARRVAIPASEPPAAETSGDLEALKKDLDLQQSLLRQSIKKIEDKIKRNNSLLPADMRVVPREGIVPRDRVIGEEARLEITTSSGPSAMTSNGAARNSDAPGGGGGNGNNSLLLTDVQAFPKEVIVPRDRVIGEKAHLKKKTSSGSSVLTCKTCNGAARISDTSGGGGNGNYSLLPTDVQAFPKEVVVPRDGVIGEEARLKPTNSCGPSALTSNGAARNGEALCGGGGNGPEKAETSASDFAEFVDDLAEFMHKMDEAFDDHTIDSVPKPVDIELKNNRARTA